MVSKERLYQLVEGLPDDAVPEAERMLAELTTKRGEGLPRFLAEAPWDDEPETEEERQAVAEADEDIRRGNLYTLDEVRRELGL